MKDISKIIVLVTAVVLIAEAEESKHFSRNVREIDRNKDGVPDVRFETTYRGTNKVIATYQEFGGKNARAFYVDGALVMLESDENGDGMFVTVILFSGNKMEAFERQRDGTATPVTPEKLKILEMEMKAVRDFWNTPKD